MAALGHCPDPPADAFLDVLVQEQDWVDCEFWLIVSEAWEVELAGLAGPRLSRWAPHWRASQPNDLSAGLSRWHARQRSPPVLWAAPP